MNEQVLLEESKRPIGSRSLIYCAEHNLQHRCEVVENPDMPGIGLPGVWKCIDPEPDMPRYKDEGGKPVFGRESAVPERDDVAYLRNDIGFTYLDRISEFTPAEEAPTGCFWVVDVQGDEYLVARAPEKDYLLRMAVHDDGKRCAWVVCEYNLPEPTVNVPGFGWMEI